MDDKLSGIEVGTDCAIVVHLKSSQMHFLRSYLRTKNMTESKMEKKISDHSAWYGIVDGCHSNDGLRLLKSTNIQ